jgi:transposase-like protein
VNKPMSDSRSFEVLTANPVRLSSSPARSYRSWSDEEKAMIVEQTLVAGANVSAIARSMGWIRHSFLRGVARRLPRGWLRHWMDRRAGRSGSRALNRCGVTR